MFFIVFFIIIFFNTYILHLHYSTYLVLKNLVVSLQNHSSAHIFNFVILRNYFLIYAKNIIYSCSLNYSKLSKKKTSSLVNYVKQIKNYTNFLKNWCMNFYYKQNESIKKNKLRIKIKWPFLMNSIIYKFCHTSYANY